MKTIGEIKEYADMDERRLKAERKVKALQSEVEKLKAWMIGRDHYLWCDKWDKKIQKCNCGLKQLLTPKPTTEKDGE